FDVNFAPVGTDSLIVLASQYASQPAVPSNVLLLDALYDKVTPGSFVVIERSTHVRDAVDNPLVARVEAVAAISPSLYGQPATKATPLTLDRPWLTKDAARLSDIRDTSVYLQSELLPLDGEPYDADIGGVGESLIELDEVYDGLPPGRMLIISGERTD